MKSLLLRTYAVSPRLKTMKKAVQILSGMSTAVKSPYPVVLRVVMALPENQSYVLQNLSKTKLRQRVQPCQMKDE
jgi:hypothetical protein